MDSSQSSISNQLTDVAGLRVSGIFSKGNEPSIRTLRNWTKLRRIPYHKVGHFIYFDPAEVAAHIRTKLRIAPNELDALVVDRQQPVPAPASHRRGSATTLSAERVAQLMEFLEEFEGGALVPYFVLCLFAGVRPCFRDGEMSRFQPESVNLDTGVIHIEPEVSKVRMKRAITIQPNLSTWLRAYPLKQHAIIPPGMDRLHHFVFGKFELSHDILRHTFISMFVGKFRSVAEAALQAGNSEEIIRRHYLDLKSISEG
jgi:integrase